MGLEEKYGYCIIPKNTLLYRGAQETLYRDCLFFATKYSVAKAFGDQIQIWKTTKEIRVLFLVRFLCNRAWAYSELANVFNDVFPEESNSGFDDLDVKHRDKERRNKFVQKLYNEYDCSGWFTSVEEMIDVEVCLFNSKMNAERIALIEPNCEENKKYYKDSLDKIKIFPSKSFFENTKAELLRTRPVVFTGKDDYSVYRNFMNRRIREEAIDFEESKVIRKHRLFNLRLKLKI